MRAIDADALMEVLDGAINMMQVAMEQFDMAEDKELEMELKAYRDIRNGVAEQPTIEPERKTGKWIKAIDELGEAWSCSACTTEFTVEEMDEFPKWAKFCPECGAAMSGGEQDGKKQI